jgi:hypothetical protein
MTNQSEERRGQDMDKAIERRLKWDEMIGRFRVAIDEEGESVDWDSTVARFLLAVVTRRHSSPIVAPARQPSASIAAPERASHARLSPLSRSCVVGI